MHVDEPDLDVAIIGAGFSGIGMGIALLKHGWSKFEVLERAAGLGGTWRDNHYPGCACDIPSILYSYSFEQSPRWSRMYPRQPEILSYLMHCAEKYGVSPYFRFRHGVRAMRFDEAKAFWRIETDQGEIKARAVVSGMGALSEPLIPAIPGQERFAGPAFHSAHWDHGVDLAGKTVAVIGTGASSIQFVPELAKIAGRVLVFQRTPPWILPKADRPLGPMETKIYAAVPMVQRAHREALFWLNESRALGFVVDPKIMMRAQRLALRFMQRAVPDAVLRAKLTPNYIIGCKRILISNTYYPTMMQPHVEVITEGIGEIASREIVTQAGRRVGADAIIYGTGFKTLEPLSCDVYGRDGRSLRDEWQKHGAEAHLGLSSAGFPNLFFLMGPNTGLGHNSMVAMIEAQIGYAMQGLARMRAKGLASLEVRQEAQQQSNVRLQSRIARTVWQSGCRSWYVREDGRNTTLWPGFVFQYQNQVRRFDAADFQEQPMSDAAT